MCIIRTYKYVAVLNLVHSKFNSKSIITIGSPLYVHIIKHFSIQMCLISITSGGAEKWSITMKMNASITKWGQTRKWVSESIHMIHFLCLSLCKVSKDSGTKWRRPFWVHVLRIWLHIIISTYIHTCAAYGCQWSFHYMFLVVIMHAYLMRAIDTIQTGRCKIVGNSDGKADARRTNGLGLFWKVVQKNTFQYG